MSGDDPIRLADDPGAPEELRDLFSGAQDALPTDAELSAVKSRIDAAIAGPGSPGQGGSGGGGMSIGAKLALAGVVAGAALVLLWPADDPAEPDHEAPAVTDTGGGGHAAAATEERPLPVVADAAVAAPPPEEPVEQAPVVEAETPAEEPAEPDRAPQAPPDEAASAQGDEPEATAEGAEEDGLELLAEARQALGTEPAQAYWMTVEHLRRFPRSAYAQEREAIGIEALVRLGRMDEARFRAEHFLSTYPGSAHAVRVRSLVGEPGAQQ